jgi:phosphoglycolate phosphatase
MNASGLIAFDLDGTLIDSLEGIHSSLAHACHQLQCETPSITTLKQRIGPPLHQYLPELLGLSGEQQQPMLEALLQAFRSHHDSQGWRNFQLYDGVITLLEQLRAMGYELHVVTQKPHPIALDVLRQARLESFLNSLHAPLPGVSFDKSSSLVQLRRQGDVRHWYVGDTAADQQAAIAASYHFVAATYGYGMTHDAAMQISCPLELLQVLEGAA